MDKQGIKTLVDLQMEKANKKSSLPTLRGQRLAAPQKGINIIGGKKIVVK